MDRNETPSDAIDAQPSAPRAIRQKPGTARWWLLAAGAVLVIVYLAFGSSTRNQRASVDSKNQVVVNKPADTSPLLTKPAATPAKINYGPLTRQHLGQFDEWIRNAPRRHYFIQLLSTDARHTGEIEGFLAKATEALDPAEIRAYRSSLSGHDRVGVIYGSYPTREDAAAAMLALPETVKATQPFPRQVSRLPKK